MAFATFRSYRNKSCNTLSVAEAVVTACPLCKKAIGRGTRGEVRDLAEIVAAGLK